MINKVGLPRRAKKQKGARKKTEKKAETENEQKQKRTINSKERENRREKADNPHACKRTKCVSDTYRPEKGEKTYICASKMQTKSGKMIATRNKTCEHPEETRRIA